MNNELLVQSLRKYQLEAVEAANAATENCLLDLPTGSGKSHIIAGICATNPTKRVLILSHVQEILLQNVDKLKQYIDPSLVGIYSAGLGFREFKYHCVASIQSVYNRSPYLTEYDIIIIDEAHMVPPAGEGRYQTLLGSLPNKKVIGLTATPYRLSSGYLTDGPIFKTVAYTADIVKLIEEGYLCSLVAKSSAHTYDTTGIKKIAGDFSKKDLLNKFDKAIYTTHIVKELVTKYQHRNSWLIFAIDISHAEHVTEELSKYGIRAGVLHSQKKNNRQELIDKFKAKEIQALVNVEILTTGFDAPNVDMIVLLRPTESPGLHVQMIGRGLRPAPGKENCLILDYARNVERLGPINDVQVKSKDPSQKKEASEKPCKVCPTCLEILPVNTKICPSCKYTFELAERGKQLKTSASTKDIILTKPKEKFTTYTVEHVYYYRHKKTGSPDCLRVSYQCGLLVFNQYVLLEHYGRPALAANAWWLYRARTTPPNTVTEALERTRELKPVKAITVYNQGKYPEIVRVAFNE
jgi:DNA repair protein RadD